MGILSKILPVKKNYLNGMDWAMNAIHNNSLKQASSSNDFIVVMELSGTPDIDKFSQLLLKFTKKFPLLNGAPSRNILNLAPYWKYSKDSVFNKDILNIVNKINISNTQELSPYIVKFSNESMNDIYVLFRLYIAADKSFLAVKFDHRLFDGRGAEGFLSLLQREWLNKEIFVDSNNADRASQLCKWRDKILSGKALNRMMIKLLDNGSPATLSHFSADRRLSYNHKCISFDLSETVSIISNANKQAGLFMIMPYLLANFVSTFHSIVKKRGNISGDYIIPVNIDPRQNDEVLKNTFFNNWSMIFLKVSPEIAEDKSALIDTLKEQIYTNISGKYAHHLKNVNYLMRILPHKKMFKLMQCMLKGSAGSFSFSYLKECVYDNDSFMDNKILNLYHVPNMPIQPGIGLFFSSFKGRINAVLSFIDTIFSEEEIKLIENSIKKLTEN